MFVSTLIFGSPPNGKLTDDEERANGVRPETCGSSAFGPASGWTGCSSASAPQCFSPVLLVVALDALGYGTQVMA